MKTIDLIFKTFTSTTQNIYVENVRSLLECITAEAIVICEEMVETKIFEKRFGLICPNECCNGRIITSAHSMKDFPEKIECVLCSIGDTEESEFNPEDLKVIEFYRLRALKAVMEVKRQSTENAITLQELESIGYEVTKDNISYGDRYLEAIEIKTNGKRIININMNYCGYTALGVKEDGGTRTCFNGHVTCLEDLKFVLDRIL